MPEEIIREWLEDKCQFCHKPCWRTDIKYQSIDGEVKEATRIACMKTTKLEVAL